MKKQKTAKRAFISSLISLALCVTMLVGTTFAWYTDSVTSGRNTIVSGSLDMALERYNGNTTDTAFADNWQNVDGTTKIFNETDGKLTFEPGAVQVAYVRVKNNGDLAFKYSLAAKVFEETAGTNQAGASFLLSDYLKFGTATTDAPYTSREAAINAVKNGATKLQDAQLANGAVIKKDDAPVIVALVIYMPEDVGNDANPQPDKKPTISFGLNALATQATIENDSFSNTYDDAATMPDGKVDTVNGTVDTNGAITLYANATPDETSGKQTSAEFPAGSLTAGDAITLTVETNDVPPASTFSVSDDTATVAAIDLTVRKNGVEITEFNGQAVTVTTYIAKGLAPSTVNVVYTGTGAQPTDVSYDGATGKLTFKTTHFSEYVVTATGVVAYDVATKVFYGTLQDAFDQSGSVIILKPISGVSNKNYTIASSVSVTLDLNGYVVNTVAPDGNTAYTIQNAGTLTIKDSTDKAKNGSGKGKLEMNALDPDPQSIPGFASNLITNTGTLVVESGWLYNASSGYAAFAIDNYTNNGKSASLTINGGKVTTNAALSIRQAVFTNTTNNIVINGGIVGSYWIQNYGTAANSAIGNLTINGGEFLYTIRLDMGYSIDNGYNIKADKIVVDINGGVFNGSTFAIYEHNNANKKVIRSGSFKADVSDYCIDECFAKKVGDYYVIKPKSEATDEDFFAKVGNTGYFSIASAIDAAGSQPVILMKDFDGFIYVNNGQTVTLDLNGHSIRNYAGSGNTDTINVYNSSNLILTDTSTGTKGVVSSVEGVAIWTGNNDSDASTITINGGVHLEGPKCCIQSTGGHTSITINDAVTVGGFDINEGSTLTDNR